MEELASVIILGILAQWVAWRIKVPAILPLLLIGLIVGPLYAYFHDGIKLLEPIWHDPNVMDGHGHGSGHGNAHGHGLFPKMHLFHFVELAIGLILFEGGMSLQKDELKGVGPSIINLITLGSLVTFIGGA